MDPEIVIVEETAGNVLMIGLADPSGRNALTVPMREQLLDVLRRLDERNDVGAAVLYSRSKNFSVGGDVSTMGAHTPVSWRYRLQLTTSVALAMAQNSKPIVAAVEGWAAGGGMSMALLCDTIVAAETARFKAPFGDLGLIGDVGILHMLPQRVGTARARQIMLYGEAVAAEQALEWGLADRLCAPGEAVNEAVGRARIAAAKAPLANRATKAILAAGLESYLAREREVQEWLANSEDHVEGQRAFMEKRPAAFKGK